MEHVEEIISMLFIQVIIYFMFNTLQIILFKYKFYIILHVLS